MTLGNISKLAIAALAYFVPALFTSIAVCVRHGFHGQLGWFFLAALSVFRIVGSSCQLATDQHPHMALSAIAAITNSIGLVPLVLSWMGMMSRVNEGMPSTRRVNSRVFYAIHIISYLALSLGIVGGINQTHVDNSHDTSSGTHYRSGCIVLILIAFILLCIITVISATRLRAASGGDGLLVYAGLASIPFFLVRIVYGFLTAFAPQSKAFNWRNPSVFAMAFMQFLMEVIICTLYLAAGVVVPPLKGVQTAEGPNEGANWLLSVLKRQAKPSPIYNVTSHPDIINQSTNVATGQMEHGTISAET